MNETVSYTTTLRRWQGGRSIYHLISITGEAAEAIAMHERIRRLELGSRRGFGSVKVSAKIGDTGWKSSVFPQNKSTEWILLISKKVMRAEDLAMDDELTVELELI